MVSYYIYSSSTTANACIYCYKCKKNLTVYNSL